MREEKFKRDSYWIVEVMKEKAVVFRAEFKVFEDAWDKYYSFKNHDERATISLQRRFREQKIA